MTPVPTTRSRPPASRSRAAWRGAASGLQLLLFLFVLAVANSPDLHHAFAGHDHGKPSAPVHAGHEHCRHHGATGSEAPDDHHGHDSEEGCVVRLMHSGAAEAPASAGPALVARIETIRRPTPFPEAEIASAETTVFDRGPPVL